MAKPTRYREGGAVMRDQKPPHREFVVSDPEKEKSLDFIQGRRRELLSRLNETQAELTEGTSRLGQLVAEGGDPEPLAWDLSQKRETVAALRAGVGYLDMKLAILLRALPWRR